MSKLDNIGELLTGKFVRLWPYAKDTYPQSLLVNICDKITESGQAHKVFWPYATKEGQCRMDLAFFLNYMESCLPLLVQDLEGGEEGGDFVGMLWFDQITMGHKANVNIFMQRRAWGKKAKEAGRDIQDMSLEEMDVFWNEAKSL